MRMMKMKIIKTRANSANGTEMHIWMIIEKDERTREIAGKHFILSPLPHKMNPKNNDNQKKNKPQPAKHIPHGSLERARGKHVRVAVRKRNAGDRGRVGFGETHRVEIGGANAVAVRERERERERKAEQQKECE